MKIKKKTLKKIIFLTMLIMTLLNAVLILLGNSNVFATDAGFVITTPAAMVLEGLVYIITLVPKLSVMIIGLIIQALLNATISSTTGQPTECTVENIIFSGVTDPNKKLEGVELLSIDFFNLTSGNDTANTFRLAVAKWYYIIRLIAAAVLLVMLIYVGIRMALSTTGKDEAKYKSMLIDWVTSMALLFLLHYIIRFVILINTALINSLSTLVQLTGNKTVGEALSSTLVGSMFTSGTGGIFAAIMYIMLKGQALMFFVMYLKRMVTTGFLIMISPLITITYAIDKMGDNKAQALNTWLKEFVYGILIQPFHCLIYLAFFGAIADILTSKSFFDLSAYILAFVVLMFIKKAEEILRKIFSFEASSSPTISQSGQNFMNATKQFGNAGMKVGAGIANFRAAGGVKAVKNDLKQFRQNRKENRQLKKEYKSNDSLKSNFSSFSEFKESETGQKALTNIRKTNAAEMKAKADKKKNAKIEKRARKDFDNDVGEGSYDKLKTAAAEKDKNGKPTKNALAAQERLNQLNSAAEQKINNSVPKRAIRGVAKGAGKVGSGISKVADGYRRFSNSRTGQFVNAYLKDSTKAVAAIATGSFIGGATGELNDVYSGAQFGHGLVKGLFENSQKTITDEATKSTEQYKEITGNKADCQEIKAKGRAGMYEEINSLKSELVREITRVIGDKQKSKEIIAELMSKIGNGKAVDIAGTLKQLNIEDPDKEANIKERIEDFSQTVVESHIYSNIKQAESVGMTVETLTERIEKKTEKIEKQVGGPQINVQTTISQRNDGSVQASTTTNYRDFDGSNTQTSTNTTTNK